MTFRNTTIGSDFYVCTSMLTFHESWIIIKGKFKPKQIVLGDDNG